MPLNKQFDEFGPLRCVFEEGDLPHTYLCLLHLGDGAPASVAMIRNACKNPETRDEHIIAMFVENNWRPNLAAAVAAIFRPNPPVIEFLWNCFDRGSWVQPQLAVAAFLADRAFLKNAMHRLENRCPMIVPVYTSALERHVAAGSANIYERSAKAFCSLLALTKKLPEVQTTITQLGAAADVQMLMASDEDNSAGLAIKWHSAVAGILANMTEP